MSRLEAAKLDSGDRAAIEAIITEFFDLVNRGPQGQLAELFVIDGKVKALDIGVNVQSSQTIAEFYAA